MAEQNILPDQGLSTKQVEERFAAGQHNLPLKPLTRSISQIIKVNTFTLFNLVNVVLGALIVTTGSYKNLLFLGVAIINTAIGTIQEIQAKHQIKCQFWQLLEPPSFVMVKHKKSSLNNWLWMTWCT